VVVRVKPGEQYAAERELRQRLKRAFDEKGVEIPFPQRTTHVVQSEAPPRSPDASDESDASAESDASS
jgi:small conductance mechanosensitive channel